ncbi:MAG TPA: hypothetical protein VNU66_05175 [Mycobacteriales bacterium]|nr:hypothetical protein [Mycobacteriales bacterium]
MDPADRAALDRLRRGVDAALVLGVLAAAVPLLASDPAVELLLASVGVTAAVAALGLAVPVRWGGWAVLQHRTAAVEGTVLRTDTVQGPAAVDLARLVEVDARRYPTQVGEQVVVRLRDRDGGRARLWWDDEGRGLPVPLQEAVTAAARTTATSPLTRAVLRLPGASGRRGSGGRYARLTALGAGAWLAGVAVAVML